MLKDVNEKSGRAIRCAVELRDLRDSRVGTAWAAGLDGLRVHFLPEVGNSLSTGNVVEVRSEASPIGPIRASARIASVDADQDRRGRSVISASLKFLQWNERERTALEARLRAVRTSVLTLGLDDSLDEAYLPGFRVIRAATPDDILHRYDQEDVAVLVLGPQLGSSEAIGILSRCHNEFPGAGSINIVLTMDSNRDFFQDLVDDDRLFYLAQSSIPNSQLRSIIIAAGNRFRERFDVANEALTPLFVGSDRILDFSARVSQQGEFWSATAVLLEAVRELVGASRADCLVYDRNTETLWSLNPLTQQERRESAVAGLVGYVARTGEGVHLDRVGTDPRFDPNADDPGGRLDDRFVAQPVFGMEEALVAVVTAIRESHSIPFSLEDLKAVKVLTECAGPTLSMLLLQIRDRQALLSSRRAALRTPELFWQEAVEQHTADSRQEGSVLHSIPAWLRRSHLLILLLVGSALAYVSFARINENAIGPVLIRARSKVSVTTLTAGVVWSVVVSVGDHIREGDLLARLQSAPGDALLARMKQEIRSPRDGVVSEIGVRSGQAVNAGDQVASIVDESAGNELICFLPGEYAPQIRPGMNIVLRVQGYPDSHEVVPIDGVVNEMLGPQEATRYAGRESAGVLSVTGPVLITRSLMRRSTFDADGRRYRYHDGMVGEAEVTVRSDSMIVSIIPGLKQILRHPKDIFRIN